MNSDLKAHARRRLPHRARSIAVVGALLAVTLLLSACGLTDEEGTHYKIVMISDDFPDDETLAGIGAPFVGETVRVTFEVTRKDRPSVDRTALAQFTLEDKRYDDDLRDFVFTLSTDLAVQPYHTLRSDVDEANVSLCVSYQGPEILKTEPLVTCERISTLVPASD